MKARPLGKMLMEVFAELDAAEGEGPMAEVQMCVVRRCVHFEQVRWIDPWKGNPGEKPVCAAFPDGIPSRIAQGDDQHLTIASDQEGELVFQEK